MTSMYQFEMRQLEVQQRLGEQRQEELSKMERMETALERILTLSTTQDGAIDMKKIARKALGR
jgi:hypothetical protein